MKILSTLILKLVILGSLFAEDEIPRIDATSDTIRSMVDASQALQTSALSNPTFMEIDERDNTRNRLTDFVRFSARDADIVAEVDPEDNQYQMTLNNTAVQISKRYNEYRERTIEVLTFYKEKFEETGNVRYKSQIEEEEAILSIINEHFDDFNLIGFLGERLHYNHTIRMRNESELELYGPPVDIRRE